MEFRCKQPSGHFGVTGGLVVTSCGSVTPDLLILFLLHHNNMKRTEETRGEHEENLVERSEVPSVPPCPQSSLAEEEHGDKVNQKLSWIFAFSPF